MPDRDGRRRVLILGGTGDARALAGRLVAGLPGLPPLDVITALAGRTRAVPPLPGRVRVGGFGGAAGLADYLRAERVDVLVDATHPFAAQISAHAVDACRATDVQRVALVRPAWQAQPGDRWIEVADAGAAARELPRHGRRAFLAIGRHELAAFAALDPAWFLVRLVDLPASPLPLRECRVIAGRGPFDAAAERALLLAHAVDVVVCKASGGAATAGKLAAARDLGLPVVMIRRPPAPPAPTVGGVDAAVVAIRTSLDVPASGHDTGGP